MAAGVIEALFWGNDVFDFEPDPGAVVLWFSDDPNLNDQTRTRLMQASEKFTYANLVRIEPPFAKPRLDPGKVYFLNTQKLGAKSRLVKGDAGRRTVRRRYLSRVLTRCSLRSTTRSRTPSRTRT